MAKKKFKLSKSLIARMAAISVLVGMGGFAVWQSQGKKDEAEVAKVEGEKEGGDSGTEESESGASGGKETGGKETERDVASERPKLLKPQASNAQGSGNEGSTKSPASPAAGSGTSTGSSSGSSSTGSGSQFPGTRPTGALGSPTGSSSSGSSSPAVSGSGGGFPVGAGASRSLGGSSSGGAAASGSAGVGAPPASSGFPGSAPPTSAAPERITSTGGSGGFKPMGSVSDMTGSDTVESGTGEGDETGSLLPSGSGSNTGSSFLPSARMTEIEQESGEVAEVGTTGSAAGGSAAGGTAETGGSTRRTLADVLPGASPGGSFSGGTGAPVPSAFSGTSSSGVSNSTSRPGPGGSFGDPVDGSGATGEESGATGSAESTGSSGPAAPATLSGTGSGSTTTDTATSETSSAGPAAGPGSVFPGNGGANFGSRGPASGTSTGGTTGGSFGGSRDSVTSPVTGANTGRSSLGPPALPPTSPVTGSSLGATGLNESRDTVLPGRSTDLPGRSSASPVESLGSGSSRASGGLSGNGFPERDGLDARPLPGVSTDIGQGSGTTFPGRNPSGSSLSGSGSAGSLGLEDRSAAMPGAALLEGAQTPALQLEKRVPKEVQVGSAATFQLVVKNVGGSTAQDVTVIDRIPAGSRLTATKPEATSAGDTLIWRLGAIEPGDEVLVEMVLVPERTGEIGSVAQVAFQAQASGRSVATQPRLAVTMTAPPVVTIQDTVEVQIRIQNDGDGAANQVVIETDIPDQVAHPAGRELKYEVGTLGPGEYRDLKLQLASRKAGNVAQRLIAHGEGTQVAEDTVEYQIIAPQIAMDISGPTLRYLDRKAIHKVEVENTGTADATNVALVAQLPQGLRFEQADRNGTYDARTHAVYWSLEALPVQTGDTIRLVTIPEATGEMQIDYRLTGDLISEQAQRQKMDVRQLAELFFEIDDEVDPIEVGSETVYHVTVTNQGSKDATNVGMRMVFPAGIRVTDDIKSPVRYRQEGQTLVFDMLERLAPDETVTIQVRAEGAEPGDQRVAFELSSAERPDWVRKEESTRVYADR